MKRVITRTALAVSGAVLGLIGGALMFAPKAFLEMSHVMVERDPGLMSELAAPSGVLIISGALMMLAAAKFRFADLALLTGAIVYGSYGVGRLVSMALHGVPSDSLIAAMIIELGIAAVLVGLRLTAPVANQRNIAKVELGEVIV